MALLTTQKIVQSGLVPTMVAASVGGDSWEPTSTTFLFVENGGGSSITVTVHTTATAFGQPIQDVVVAVPAGQSAMIGPFEPGEVAQPATGEGSIAYSGVTSVTVAAIEL